MNAAAGRSRSGAEIDTWQWRPIRSGTKDWTHDQLAQVCGTAVNVAAGQITVRLLKIGRIHGVAGQNAIAKAGREPFDLRFDPLRHVALASKRHVRVGPEHMLAGIYCRPSCASRRPRLTQVTFFPIAEAAGGWRRR